MFFGKNGFFHGAFRILFIVRHNTTLISRSQLSDSKQAAVPRPRTCTNGTLLAMTGDGQGSRMKDCDPLRGPARKKPQLAKPRFDRPTSNCSERIAV